MVNRTKQLKQNRDFVESRRIKMSLLSGKKNLTLGNEQEHGYYKLLFLKGIIHLVRK